MQNAKHYAMFHHMFITYCLCYGYGVFFLVGYSVRVLRVYVSCNNKKINSAKNVATCAQKLHLLEILTQQHWLQTPFKYA